MLLLGCFVAAAAVFATRLVATVNGTHRWINWASPSSRRSKR
jgi:hypothetical protein